jgi:hypothetical protein
MSEVVSEFMFMEAVEKLAASLPERFDRSFCGRSKQPLEL